MSHPFIRAGFRVLCQLLLFVSVSDAFAQNPDTAVTFKGSQLRPEPEKTKRKLECMITAGIGPYTGFNQGEYKTFLQPSVGFDFVANPGDFINLLFGAHIGLSDPLTTGVLIGVRQPFFEGYEGESKLFGDLALLIFDEAERIAPLGVGVHAAVGGRTNSFLELEYRLAGEYRGQGSASGDGTNAKPLWWIGVEAGVAFSLASSKAPFTHKDSVRAALLNIASAEEIAEFDAITSSYHVDEWLDMFWAKRDLTPDTYRNEAREEYERRVRRANERFSRPKRLGISTDPGRVLALYGNPDYIEEATSVNDESYKYYLWVYTTRVRDVAPALFLFEVSGVRDWRQAYSNVPGEPTGILPANLPATMRKWF
jgi:GWxTD domain-containing protein